MLIADDLIWFHNLPVATETMIVIVEAMLVTLPSEDDSETVTVIKLDLNISIILEETKLIVIVISVSRWRNLLYVVDRLVVMITALVLTAL